MINDKLLMINWRSAKVHFFCKFTQQVLQICENVLHLHSENKALTYGVMVALQFLDLPV